MANENHVFFRVALTVLGLRGYNTYNLECVKDITYP
jgi:hypothetical protein